MIEIPLVLPIKANEAAALADLVYQQLEGSPLTADLRNRFAARLPQLALETFTPYPGSLARDPIHPSTYYIAIDTQSAPMLLRIALASSPASGLFPGAMLIGRMRPGGGREIVINAVPFQASDRDAVRMFAEQVDPAFLPRPQGPQSAIAVEGDFPAAFRAFRAILKSTGLNFAATVGDYDTALWSAIRAGWREGWNAQTSFRNVDPEPPCVSMRAEDAMSSLTSDPSATDYTKFSVAGSLEHLCETYDRIRAAKAAHVFDFEIETPGEVSHALDWMKSHGKPVQFIVVNPGADLRASADTARHFNAMLSFPSATEPQLEQIGIATGGRFHYRMKGDEEAIRLAASSLLGKSI
jgi:hypothetical protein